MPSPEDYFKQPVFQIVAKELWRRYWLKGEFGSSIGLRIIQEVDNEPLRSFLGITLLAWDKKKRIRVLDLEEAFAASVLKWDLEDFVCYVTQQPLIQKKDAEQAAAEALSRFKEKLKEIDPRFIVLLSERQLREWQQKSLPDFTVFQQVAAALGKLPQENFVRLPVFAYEITRDPHAFDDSRDAGQLLLQVLSSLSSQLSEELSELEKAEQRHGLLAEFHLLKDDIMNYAAIRGLTAFASDGTESQMWRQACFEGISWNVPLKEILRMPAIRPASCEKVLVVENSGIYSILVELLPHVPIVCSSGQFTFAIWQLLRKIAKAGTSIYYSGDLDPEGLGMAQKLQSAFGNQLHFLGMNAQNFQLAKTSINLSDVRLKKLQHLKNEKLITLGNLIGIEKKVAYQEGFLERLIEEVKGTFSEC